MYLGLKTCLRLEPPALVSLIPIPSPCRHLVVECHDKL